MNENEKSRRNFGTAKLFKNYDGKQFAVVLGYVTINGKRIYTKPEVIADYLKVPQFACVFVSTYTLVKGILRKYPNLELVEATKLPPHIFLQDDGSSGSLGNVG